ncbi:MAG: DUF3109 family protein [Flavobacteriales bacterium]|nr:DUF3109 family protein [Flavobacteriales bacterium]MCX7768103.1 DUF3109 family protein [Flavobacteriales bacterium]MDW8409605.1 DUF3109 family protein [Flavobacteriales bacterium]
MTEEYETFIEIDNKWLSLDLFRIGFICDINRCKGACCEAGEQGAPLSDTEAQWLEEELEKILNFLEPDGQKAIELQGPWVRDEVGRPCTPLRSDGGACVYAIRGKENVWRCALEKAWEAGLTKSRKPLSCHLYPARITQEHRVEVIGYHSWHICAPACALGQALRIPLFRFLKDGWVRAYGWEFYQKLETAYTYYFTSPPKRG